MQRIWLGPPCIALVLSSQLAVQLHGQKTDAPVHRVGVSALLAPDSLSRRAVAALDSHFVSVRPQLAPVPWSETYQLLLNFAYTAQANRIVSRTFNRSRSSWAHVRCWTS